MRICLLVASLGLSLSIVSSDLARGREPVRKPTGIAERALWSKSRVRGTPDPPLPYITVPAFPQLKFYEPLAMTQVPGENRLVVAQRGGKVFTFSANRRQALSKLLVDVKRTVYGVALHPRYQENGHVFLSTERANPEGGGRIQVIRLTAPDPAKHVVDPSTERLIIEWPADGHRGGCLRFGPDKLLYIGVGDGRGIADQLKTGQDLSDLLAAMLRIDVDRQDDGLAYGIPKDNPFVDREGARGEIWAYGLRQPWKFSFDSAGRLWVGEVGQDLWEMLYVVKRGGNYGWSIREGAHPFRPARPMGPTPFEEPVLEHPHSDFRSITGGYFYSSSRTPDLQDHYLYADYDTGQIRGLRYRDGKVTDDRQLADTQMRIVAFGPDDEGEVYLLDYVGGQIHWLVKAPPVVPHNFPRKLSETGLFRDTRTLAPERGLIPYSVNAALWSDGATKERFIALPGESQIEFESVVYPQPAPGAQAGWRFPDNAVLVKTFFLETEVGNPASRRRLETRILHHKLMPGSDSIGAQFWRGYTYVWNDEQTDAELLGKDGLDRVFTVKDPQAANGVRRQTWRFPSRAECTLCHTMAAKYALGVTTLQMNKDHNYDGVVANQIDTLAHLGVFKQRPSSAKQLARLVDYNDGQADINLRARSYLHANCSHCHRKWGGGNAEFQMLAALPLAESGATEMTPQQGRFKLGESLIIKPGDPRRSMSLHRMKLLELGRMPHVGSNVVHDEAVELIEKWIRNMKAGDLQKPGIIASGE